MIDPRDNAEADVIIIGAGPIGIELAAALKVSNVNCVILEAGNIGATLQWWAPGTRFFSSPERIELAGVPLVTPNQDKATREEYLAYLRGVAKQFDLPIVSGTRVTDIDRQSNGFALSTRPSVHGVGGPEELIMPREAPPSRRSDHDKLAARHGSNPKNSTHPLAPSLEGRGSWRASKLVLAIGNMHHPRMIDVPGEDLPHVRHYLDDPHRYFGRRVLIVGGKNSAVEAAIRLHRVGAHVTISYRGEMFDPSRVKYWLRPELEWLISKGRIAFLPRTIVAAIDPEHVRLGSVDNGDARDIEADDVLLLTGYVQHTMLFDQLGIELEGDERAPRHDPETMQTNVPGAYVAGTATGGSQKRARVFIETSHVHVLRIVRDIAGVDPPWRLDPDYAAMIES